MKIKRSQFHEMYENKYCPKCGKIQEMISSSFCLPGILSQICSVCSLGIRTNYLEDDNDLIFIPNNYKLPKNIKPIKEEK